MKIYMKSKDGRSKVIRIPIWVLQIGSGRVINKFIKESVDSKKNSHKNIIDKSNSLEEIDPKLLKKCLKILRRYKGLEIINIEEKDGNVVRIVV